MDKSNRKYYSTGKLLSNKSVEKNRSDYVVFATFLVISTILWLLIKLSQEYSVSYNMHIYYKDAPKDKLITQEIDSTVAFNITASGFYLLKISFMHPEELIIHLDRYTLHRADENVYYISTQPLKKSIAALLNINQSKIGFSKNTLSFKLEKLHSKQVTVVPVYKLNFMQFYNLYSPPKLKPEKVTVYGPDYILDTLSFLNTIPVSVDNVKESMKIVLQVKNPDIKMLRLSPEKVEMSIDVKKFTQSSIIVPVINPDKTKNIETFPSNVKVYYNVALVDYDKINRDDFMVILDLNNVDLYTAEKLYLKVVRKPDFVHNVRIEPSEVEFIIIK
jgi:hypothetical protein